MADDRIPRQTGSPWFVLGRYILSMLGWRLASFLGIVLLWGVASTLSGGSLPGPLSALKEFQQLANPQPPGHGLQPENSIWVHLGASALRAYSGLLLALLIFVPLGVLLGSGRFIYCSTMGVVEFGRSVPSFMLLLVLLSLRITGEWGRMICIVYAVGIVLTDYTATAVRNVPSEQVEPLRLMGAGPWRGFWGAIWVPVFLNAVLPALRISVGISLIVSLVVETMIQPEKGLGVLLNTKMGQVDFSGALALIIVTGFLGWIGNVLATITADVARWVLEGRPLNVPR
jgi:NitT/TauT family transport system permease protein